MPPDLSDLLPLKPFVFQVLIELLDHPQHGWSLLRGLESRTGARVLPGHLYRQLQALLDAGFIEAVPVGDSPPRGSGSSARGAAPKRLFRLTPLGRRVARAEAERLHGLLSDARVRRLLPDRKRT
jgi:DNA-binding PadR family transcriptional regulator